MTAPLRVGVVGLGVMGRHHVRVLTEIPNAEVVAVADPDPEMLARVSRERSFQTFSTAEQMLAEGGLEAIVISVPTSFHEGVALAAIEHGVPFLVEKPIAASVAAGERLVAEAERAGVIGTVGHVERFNPAVLELRRRLAEEPLGKIFQIRARRTGPMAQRIRDVGVTIDLATHDFDIIGSLAGAAPVRLHAEVARRLHSAHEDMLIATVRYANDVVGLLEANWLSPTKTRDLVIQGERGTFMVDYIAQDLWFYENSEADPRFHSLAMASGVSEGNTTRYAIARIEPLRAELDCFVAAVRGEGPVGVSLADGLLALRLAEQALRSAELGETVHLGQTLGANAAPGDPTPTARMSQP